MKSVCRLCCTSHEVAKLNDLFDAKNSRLLEKLNHFACFTSKIDVNGAYICIRCTELLNAAYEYKLICESAEAKFLAVSQLNNQKIVKVVSSPQIEFADDRRDKSFGFFDAKNDSHHTAEANYKNDDDIGWPMFYCDMCGTHETNKKDLTIHMKVHLTSKPTSKLRTESSNGKRRGRVRTSICGICSTSFRRKRELEVHMKNVHKVEIVNENKASAWICETCGKEFKSKYTLEYHINGKHVDAVAKTYSCNLCGFECRQARGLFSHKRVHSDEKPHRCDECSASFRYQTALYRHQQCVHRQEKRHKCTICNKLFFTKLRLQEHSYIHSGQHPYECTQCSRTYRYKNSLLKHKRKRHLELHTPLESQSHVKHIS